jgi:hypothetical protein
MGTLPGRLFTECPKWHSAKMDSLPSAAGQTLGKDNSFAECHQGHSAKPPSPSPSAVTAAFLCRVLSGTRQISLPSAREKALGKERFADALFAEPFLPNVTHDTRQSLYRVFLRLRRVLEALGKAIDSGSESCSFSVLIRPNLVPGRCSQNSLCFSSSFSPFHRIAVSHDYEMAEKCVPCVVSAEVFSG